MKKSMWIIVLAALLLVSSCNESNKSEINRIGSSIDWGPDYYWNSSTESVERKPW